MAKNNNKFDLIRQALGSAESSIKLAKQLLEELESPSAGSHHQKTNPSKELPGVVGIFDGEKMVAESGESFPVAENYASKSLLVAGDTLKLVEEGGEKRFKQIEHVKRHKSVGILTKKDGKWRVVTSEGSYKVLPAAVTHFDGEVGDEVSLHLPATNLSTSFGAIESISKKSTSVSEAPPVPEDIVSQQSKQKVHNEPRKKPGKPKPSGTKKEIAKETSKKEAPKKEIEYKEVEIAQATVPKAEKVELPPVKEVVDEDELT
ncbi:MAG: hypothetical protein Q8P13_02225 [bacterium]|nr:hypothetical protein [bacterium]